MSSMRAQRSALLPLFISLLAVASCRTANEPARNDTPAAETVVSTIPPFQTKEPERYSATRTTTLTQANGEKEVTRMVIGRDGLIHRRENGSEQNRLVYLNSPEGNFILWPDKKVYAVVASDEGAAAMSELEEEESSPDRLLHIDPISSAYQSLGSETVDGRGAAKYRVSVNEVAPKNVKGSEILVWVDYLLNIPIKTEMKSPEGVVYVMELSDVTLQPDKQLFQIPAGYEKIAFSALQKQLNALGLNP